LSRTLFSTSINFDLAVFELFVPLGVGGTVVLAQDALAAGRMGEAITLINTVPSAMKALLEAEEVPDSVAWVNLAGEPLKGALVERMFAGTQVERVANLYGPTETTTYSTWAVMDRGQGFVRHIGRPIANTQVYILDGRRQPVPMGVSGELYIGGAGVARGYLNRPEMTAERFVEVEGLGRLYRTGDLGRWLGDGNIEFQGRNDFQVKIRGFRIELGEIEAKLLGCAGVREAVVVAREDVAGEQRLVAYMVPQAEAALEAAALRQQLSAVLPEYMVPSAFVSLPALPLTPNGKLDRRALPAPDASAVVSRGYEPPQGEVETTIAQIWQELLGLEQVGRHDHFFELGGHSLMVITMLERLRQKGWSPTFARCSPTLTLSAIAGFGEQPEYSGPPRPAESDPADCSAITPEMLPLVRLTQEEIDHIVGSVPAAPATCRIFYPLAPLQEGILFHHLLEKEGDAYLWRTVLAFDSRHRLEAFLQSSQSVARSP
jgi:hypothetical protein